jgi:drug/metabolite transporter (DMT)-like permease
MNWFLLTLVSAISGSLTKILQKILLRDKDRDPFAFGFVFQMTVSVIFLIFTLITGTLEIPSLSGLGLNLVILILFYSVANVLSFKAFKIADASEVSIIFASSTLWSVLTAVIMLGEKLTNINVAGIFIVMLGILSINYRKTDWKVNKGHLYALFGSVLFGIAFTNDVYIINRYESISSYMIIAFALPAFATLGLKPQSYKNISQYLHKNTAPSLLLCATLYALSALTIFGAYKLGGPASIISPIQQTSIIFTVIIGYFFLNERDRLPQKIIGTLLMFTGVLMLL